MSKGKLFLITTENEIIGNPIYTRYNKLPWHRKVFCFFSKSYKAKFIDMEGFEIELFEAE